MSISCFTVSKMLIVAKHLAAKPGFFRTIEVCEG